METWKGDLSEPRHVAIDTGLGVLLNFEIRVSSLEFLNIELRFSEPIINFNDTYDQWLWLLAEGMIGYHDRLLCYHRQKCLCTSWDV